MNLDKIVAHYVTLRDRVTEMEAEHNEQLKPIKADMQMIEAAILASLQATGTESVKTASGTAYKSEVASVKVRDWASTLEWIKENEAWDMLEARVNKSAYMESGAALPGVEISKLVKVNIRRAT